MTQFSASSPTEGTPESVLEFAVSVLANNGFAITHRDAKSAVLSGPGLNSTRQNPILGASSISLRVSNNSIDADAELGGVDRMQRFLMRFPFLLGLGLGLFFCVGGGLLFGQQFGAGFGVPGVQGWRWALLTIGGAMLPVAPWLFLSPIMSKAIRRKTENAIETLLRNAAYSGKPI